jgi:hypothetical protein
MHSSARVVFVLFICGMVCQSCRTVKVSQVTADKAPISFKLPALEKSFNHYNALTTARYGMPVRHNNSLQILNDEVDDNLTNPYGAKYGYVQISSNYVRYKMGMGYAMLSGFTLFIPNLIGFPMGYYNLELQVTVEILNAKKELIGKYKGLGQGRAVVACYYGYGSTAAATKAQMQALKAALNAIRPQIQQDAQRLNSLLQEAGPIPH